MRLLVQDVCEPVALDEPIHFIVHAASQASPKYYGTDPVGTLSANVLGTYHLLNLAATHRVEAFLFFSSGEVYGQVAPERIPIRETDYGYLDPTDVRSCYGESKRMGETMCVAWAHQFGVPAKIVRPFHTYGPGMRLDDGRVFADFVADIVHDRDIVLKSDGARSGPSAILPMQQLDFSPCCCRGSGPGVQCRQPRGDQHSRLGRSVGALFPEKGCTSSGKRLPSRRAICKAPSCAIALTLPR